MPGDCPNLHTLVLFYRAQGERDMRAKKMQISKILDDGGPFVIWEKEKKAEFKQGMIIDTRVCDNPECRYLHIHAIAIDERFKHMRFEGANFKMV